MAYTSNMQIKNGLMTRYQYTAFPAQVYGSWYLLYKITRNITKQYAIVGIHGYSAARNLADQKASEYFITNAGPYISDTGQSAVVSYSDVGYYIAECVPAHTAGGLYQVDINVNRVDEAWRFTKPTGDLGNYFPAGSYPVPSNNYDEPSSSREVTADVRTFGDVEQEDGEIVTGESIVTSESEVLK